MVEYSDADNRMIERLMKESGRDKESVAAVYGFHKALLEREGVESAVYRLAREACSIGRDGVLLYKLGQELFPDSLARLSPEEIAGIAFNLRPDQLTTFAEGYKAFLAGSRNAGTIEARPTPPFEKGARQIEYRGKLMEYVQKSTGILVPNFSTEMIEEMTNRLGL